eukprot:s824_g4.t1
MTALAIFDATVKALVDARIMVVLNNHQGKAMWCCSEDDGEGLWYSQDRQMAFHRLWQYEYSEEDWLQSLRLLARRYREEPYVVGFDLRNELRGIPAPVAWSLGLYPQGYRFWPQWGLSGGGKGDWGDAALRAGAACPEEKSDALIVVEGLDFSTDLRGVRQRPLHREPLLRGRVVYEAHDYCWYHVNFFRAWLLYWLSLGWAAQAPVWLGEFGTNGYWISDGWSAEVGEVLWLSHILRYMQEHDLDYAYWALNGDKAGDADETFGLLAQDAFCQLGLRLNGPSRLCDAGLQDGDVLGATIREPVLQARAFAAIVGAAGNVVTWGAPHGGGDSRSVQQQLCDVQHVHISEFACAAIRADGSVVTWGSAVAGGDSHDVSHMLFDVVEISATNSAFAAMRLDGSVVTWGDPENGGDSSSVQEQLKHVQKVYSSSTAFAAITSDGAVVTWGASTGGGDSTAVRGDLLHVQQIHANRSAFAAVKLDGRVTTWGALASGGNSSHVQECLVDVCQIHSTARAFAAMQTDGTVVTWGAPSAGGDSSGVELVDVRQILATEDAFAAVRGDGTVVTWGCRESGGNCQAVQSQFLGFKYCALIRSLLLQSQQQQELQYVCTAGQRATAAGLVATDAAFAAIKEDGSVVAWGCARFGGDCSSVAQQLVEVQQIHASEAAFAAIKEDGTVVTWGNSSAGGDSSMVQGSLADLHRIHAASGAFAAVRNDGQVVTWGDPRGGGDSSTVQDRLVP